MKNALLVAASLVIALLAMEGLSRLVMPLSYGNRAVMADGSAAQTKTPDGGLAPGIVYRLKSQEFDTEVTHTADGYRGLARPENPEIVFLGDSFTYGVGLNDKETIPHVYCREMDFTCANLGVPGTATAHQLDRLEKYLTEKNWRPREVKLLFLGMTSALLAGNDLIGNLEVETASPQAAATGLWADVVGKRGFMLAHSNLVRIAYYIGGPLMRAKLSPQMEDATLQKALAATAAQFARLDGLSKKYGFIYSIYIIHPMQDLINKTSEKTLADIAALAKTDRVYSTAPALMEDGEPQLYYYPMDGHFNAGGAALVAEFIAAQDRAAAP